MNKKTVAVIFGANSPEYSVSLHSVSSVLRNFPESYNVVMIGITREGNWYLYQGDIDSVENNTWFNKNIKPVTISLSVKDSGLYIDNEGKLEKMRVDVIFPVVHGECGEDGTIQSVAQLANIPVVGCTRVASTLCMDKEYTHIVAQQNGIKMAQWMSIRNTDKKNLDELYEKVKAKFGMPCIVKPASTGSSYGVSKAKNKEGFIKAVEEAFKYDFKIIIEQFIEGFEIGCAVMGNNQLTLGELDEIKLADVDIFDFNEKYEDAKTEILIPARISAKEKEMAYTLAKNIYHYLDCSGMARVDMFVSHGEIFLNELNTIPGFTSHSRYPSMMKAIGLSFDQVIDNLINLALNKE